MNNLRVDELGAESCIKSSLGYLYQAYKQEDADNALVLAYNRSIELINEVYNGIGDTHIVTNDIVKVKQMQDIISNLLHSDRADVRYMGKSLAGLLNELMR